MIEPAAGPQPSPDSVGGWPSWRVWAEIEIRALVHRYNSLGDAGRFEEFIGLFSPDATYVVTGERHPYDGHEGIRAMVGMASTELGPWAEEPDFHIRHFTSTHQIDFDTELEASGRVYYQCLMSHGLDHWGRYTDRYRREGGRWVFSYRAEKRDGMVEGGWCWSLWGPGGSRVAPRDAAQRDDGVFRPGLRIVKDRSRRRRD
jgi:SnoaL-like protein